MKYTTTVEINLPRTLVVELFTNTDSYGAWQKSLVRQEHVSGETGQVGTRTQLLHKMGKREIEMLETITQRELPELFTATYEAKGVWNEARNHFEDLGNGHTRWKMDTEFRCTGFMWFLTTFMPSMFQKQTKATMQDFKTYAEGANAGEVSADD